MQLFSNPLHSTIISNIHLIHYFQYLFKLSENCCTRENIVVALLSSSGLGEWSQIYVCRKSSFKIVIFLWQSTNQTDRCFLNIDQIFFKSVRFGPNPYTASSKSCLHSKSSMSIKSDFVPISYSRHVFYPCADLEGEGGGLDPPWKIKFP